MSKVDMVHVRVGGCGHKIWIVMSLHIALDGYRVLSAHYQGARGIVGALLERLQGGCVQACLHQGNATSLGTGISPACLSTTSCTCSAQSSLCMREVLKRWLQATLHEGEATAKTAGVPPKVPTCVLPAIHLQ
jgi:hypothetical protein